MPHNYNGQKWIRNEKRCAIYARGSFKCAYCLKRARLCLDHVNPRGGNGDDNLAPSCWDCNGEKGTMSLEEWLASRAARGEPLDALAEVRQRVALLTFLPIDIKLGKLLERMRPRGDFELFDLWRSLRPKDERLSVELPAFRMTRCSRALLVSSSMMITRSMLRKSPFGA
jgi:hypothetical protein